MDYKEHISKTIVTAPAVEPVSLAETKTHLRITASDEDTRLNNLIKAVRMQAEELTGRRLITQTWKAFYAGWPDEYFIIPFPTLQSVTHIKYYDTDGSATTWSAGNYIVDTDAEPGRVVLGYSKSWPSVTLYPSNPIEIQFVCGYGAAASNVPEELRQAMLIGIERLYDKPHESYDKLLKDVFESILTNFINYGV